MSDSDSDESNFGALLFGDEANEAPPEYPIETLMVDRMSNLKEGTTNGKFKPLYRCFDSLIVEDESIEDGTEGNDSNPAGSIEVQLHKLSARLESLHPQPLAVHYRNKHHSLWGHRLWNAAKYLSKRMDQRCIDVRGKTVLELGAGLGVPSLVAYRNGAKAVVVTDYPDADLLDIIQLNVSENCKPEFVDADVASSLTTPAAAEGGTTVAAFTAVEPLLWGKTEHIDKVMAHTKNNGYDIVILSDILFNHVCNDDLVDTLLRTLSHSPKAAGYCVFSHHRAYKQLQDFEFFDKCVARGLIYEQVDEQAYPMMFPEDRGPEEVRMPVKCYKITRRYDSVGAPLDLAGIFANYAKIAASDTNSNYHWLKERSSKASSQPRFDVVIQGTGLVQSLLSAALARSGLKVLHCDGEASYGGASATLPFQQFLSFLECMKGSALGAGAKPSGHEKCEEHLYVRPRVPGAEKPHILLHDKDKLSGGGYYIDLLPASYMAKGEVLQALMKADMVRSMEFQYLNGLFFLEPADDKPTASMELRAVPLTRSSIYQTSAIGLLEKRRVMTFVKDVEASLAEQLHAKSASPADNAEMQQLAAEAAAAQAAAIFAKELAGNPNLTLSELLAKKYALSGHALDIISLMGQLDCENRGKGAKAAREEQQVVQVETPSQCNDAKASGEDGSTGLLRSVELVRQLLTSVGAFGNDVPFLIPRYGASELPQHACRTAAVWGAVFVLHRGLARVVVDEEKELQYAVLSNGQHVPTTVIVAPEELTRPFCSSVRQQEKMALPVRYSGWKNVLELEKQRAAGTLDEGMSDADFAAFFDTADGDVQLSRVVVIATKPLFTHDSIAAANGSGKSSGERDAMSDTSLPPVIIGLARCSTETGGVAIVHVVQQTSITDQVTPNDSSHVILHFTAKKRALSQDALEAFVVERFLSADASTSAAPAGTARIGLNKEKDVAFIASFTLSGLQIALNSIYGSDRFKDENGKGGVQKRQQSLLVDIPSATRESHAFAIGECEKLQQATENDRRRVLREAEDQQQQPHQHAGTAETDQTEAPATTTTAAAPKHSLFLRLVGVSTLPAGSCLDDGQAMLEAQAAYETVIAKVLGDGQDAVDAGEVAKRFIFLQRQPPVPPPVSE